MAAKAKTTSKSAKPKQTLQILYKTNYSYFGFPCPLLEIYTRLFLQALGIWRSQRSTLDLVGVRASIGFYLIRQSVCSGRGYYSLLRNPCLAAACRTDVWLRKKSTTPIQCCDREASLIKRGRFPTLLFFRSLQPFIHEVRVPPYSGDLLAFVILDGVAH